MLYGDCDSSSTTLCDSVGWELHPTNTGIFFGVSSPKKLLETSTVLFPHGQGTLHQCLTFPGPSLAHSCAEETPEQLQIPVG